MEDVQANQILLHPNNLVADDLETWIANGGGQGLANAFNNSDTILATLEAADLRGMGGAGFPTHRKWSAVREQDASDKWLICNGNEDEPGTFKDRELLERAPHQILEGTFIASLATGANHIAIYIHPHEEEAINRMGRAIDQWKAHSAGPAQMPAHIKSLEVVTSSGLYIGGEESAAIATVEGGFPFPRRKPPFPFQSGVNGCPTAVNNVETFAHVTHILRHGAAWYRDLGIGDAVGTKIFSLSGDVLKPGTYELPMGTSLRDLIYTHGGGMLQGKQFKAVFTGGPSNTILNRSDLDVHLDYDSVRARHSSLGTGAMIVISEGTGIVRRVTQYMDFFAHASCGQCPPCKIGTRQMSRILAKIDTGQGRRADLDALINLTKMLPGSGRCGLVTGAATVLESSLYKFLDEYERHLQDR